MYRWKKVKLNAPFANAQPGFFKRGAQEPKLNKVWIGLGNKLSLCLTH